MITVVTQATDLTSRYERKGGRNEMDKLQIAIAVRAS
jgi:hypothetical protein